MVLDGLIAAVDCSVQKQFGAILAAESAPGDFAFLKTSKQLFTRAERRQPDVVTGSGKSPAAKSCNEQPQPVRLFFNLRMDDLVFTIQVKISHELNELNEFNSLNSFNSWLIPARRHGQLYSVVIHCTV